MQFTHPTLLLMLWLVPILPLAWLYMYGRSERRLEAFIAEFMRTKSRRGPSVSRLKSLAWLVAAGVIMLTIAAAGPRWGESEEAAVPFGRDVVLLLDVSRSMLAGDVAPNRLQRARSEMRDLVEKLDRHRIALVAFRNSGVLLCPLTRDRGFLSHAIEEAGPGSAPPGETDVGAAVLAALDVFADDGPGCGAIVLFSDGEDMAGSTAEAIRAAAGKGIRVIAVGLGSREGAKIPALGGPGFVQFDGRDAVTVRNDGILRTVAAETGGAYITVREDGRMPMPVAQLCREYLQDISEREMQELLTEQTVQRYQWFLLPAFMCLVVVAWLARTMQRSTTKPPLRKAYVSKAVLMALAFMLSAQPETEAGRSEPGPGEAQDDLQFNAAARAFAAEDYTQAVDLLCGLPSGSQSERVRNEMALGCSLFRLAGSIADRETERLEEKAGLYRRASDAFLSAARMAPDDATALTNLTVALLAFRKTFARLKESEPVVEEESERATEQSERETEDKEAETAASADKAETGERPGEPRPDESDPPEPAGPLDDSRIEQIMEEALLREQEYRSAVRKRHQRPGAPSTVRDW